MLAHAVPSGFTHGGGAGCAKVSGAVAIAVAAAPAKNMGPRIPRADVLFRMKGMLPAAPRTKPNRF
jgi:hypothetical protein